LLPAGPGATEKGAGAWSDAWTSRLVVLRFGAWAPWRAGTSLGARFRSFCTPWSADFDSMNALGRRIFSTTGIT